MKKLLLIPAIALVLTFTFAFESFGGNGRGAMDGTGPIYLNSGCQGKPGTSANQPNHQFHGRQQGGNQFNGNCPRLNK